IKRPPFSPGSSPLLMKMPTTAAKKSPTDGTAAGVRSGWAITKAVRSVLAGSVERGAEDESPKDAAERVVRVGAKKSEAPVLASCPTRGGPPASAAVKTSACVASVGPRSAAARRLFGVAIAAKDTGLGSGVVQLATKGAPCS